MAMVAEATAAEVLVAQDVVVVEEDIHHQESTMNLVVQVAQTKRRNVNLLQMQWVSNNSLHVML